MKKLISLITLLALLVATLTVFASCGGAATASNVAATKLTGNESITWSYDADTKTLKIVGDTNAPLEMPAFEKSAAPWFSTLRTYAVKLEISGISKISDNAFYSMYSLKEIDFGSNVKEIGKCAFAFCASLAEVNIPEGVEAIGESAFEACASLKTIKLPSTVKTIDSRAFAYNHSLTSLTIEEGFLAALSTDNFNSMIEGIPVPTLNKYTVNTDGTKAPTESESTESATESEAPTETEAPATDSAETEAPATDAAKEEEPQDTTTTILAIVVLALVVLGLAVGIILVLRSNKKITKDSQTVRKNDDKYNKNGNSKGKKK